MQLLAVCVLIRAETVAIQAGAVSHPGWFFDFLFVTGVLAARLVGYKLGVVNSHQPAFDDLIRHAVAILATGLCYSAAAFITLEEMTRKAHFSVYSEMLLSFEMTMTGAARDSYPVNDFVDVFVMGELHTAEIDVVRNKFSRAVALRSQAGGIYDLCIWLRTESTDRAIDRLRQAVYLAFYISGKARLQMTIETVDMGMFGSSPTVIVGVHNVARITEARLSCNNDGPGTKQSH